MRKTIKLKANKKWNRMKTSRSLKLVALQMAKWNTVENISHRIAHAL